MTIMPQANRQRRTPSQNGTSACLTIDSSVVQDSFEKVTAPLRLGHMDNPISVISSFRVEDDPTVGRVSQDITVEDLGALKAVPDSVDSALVKDLAYPFRREGRTRVLESFHSTMVAYHRP
jgi:hypothetical protein